MNDQAAESPTRDGPNNTRFLQATSTLTIVQTYCVEGAVPKGSQLVRRDIAAIRRAFEYMSQGVASFRAGDLRQGRKPHS
jgi:hypothetical protein